MHFRLLRPDDIPAYQELLPAGFRVSTRVRSMLPSLWRELLASGHLHGGAVVDRDRRGEVIAAFGMSVFVHRQFVDACLRAPRPFISAQLYERLLDDRSPLLSTVSIAAGNAAGTLNLLILHFGMQMSNPPSPRDRSVVSTAHAGFRTTHEGYQVERVLQEVYGPVHVDFMQAGGFRQACAFQADATTSDTTALDPALQPHLMVVERSDPLVRLPGTTMSYLFQRAQPRFAFTPGEQRILQRALLDETDDGVAEALGVSRDAVKKTWRRIYQRLAAVDPALLDGAASVAGAFAPRGERRRRLIKYLRFHPEELRPFRRARPPGGSPRRP